MYAITGVTGRVGGIVARTLLDNGLSVRAVVRDATKGAPWKERGSDVALADMNDASALTAAFARVDGVFVLFPPIFDPTPGFPEAKAIIAAVTRRRSRLRSRRGSSVSRRSALRRHNRIYFTSLACWSRGSVPRRHRSAS
jgi:NAD(P)H dehydrogenase (quinone)